MVNPVGGSPQEIPAFQNPPIIVITVPSPAVFAIMRGLIDVIHSTHPYPSSYQPQGGAREHNFKPMVSLAPSIDNLSDDLDNASTRPTSHQNPERSGDPSSAFPSAPVAPPEKTNASNDPGGNPSFNIKVPDLTDHSPRSDAKSKYQQIVGEMLNRIARLVKEMNVAKEIIKQEMQNSIARKSETGSFQDKKPIITEEKNSAEAVGALEPDNQNDESRQIGLIIEGRTKNGHVEQLTVEKGDVAELLESLEQVLVQEFGEHGQKILSDMSNGTFNLTDQASAQPEDVALPLSNQAKSSNKASGLAPQGKGITPVTPSLSVGASMVSFMPYTDQAAKKWDVPPPEETYRVDQVEKTENIHPLNREGKEAKESEKPPAAASAPIKASSKTAHRKEVQELVDVASKDQKAKKISTAQRVDDPRIAPVHGKFTVDHLLNIRRQKSKGESGNSGGIADVHRLIDVFYMILCAVVCGAHTVFDIAAFIESREKWFSKILGLRGGVPSARFINRLVGSFNPNQITEMLSLWMQEAQGGPPRSGLASIVMFETFEGLIFAQEKSSMPSTAELCMPCILRFFDVKGLVIMLSHGQASKKMIKNVVRGGAHYIYDCGDDPFPGEEEILPLFAQAMVNPKSTPQVHRTDSYVEGQEMLQLCEIESENPSEHVSTISQMFSEIHHSNGKDENLYYFQSSLPKQSIWLFDFLKTQRPFENKAAWMMNISMRGRSGDDAALAAREFIALIRRYAANVLLRDQSFTAPLHVKQQRAAKESDYLMKLLKLSFSH